MSVTAATLQAPTAADIALAYHARTKHKLNRYAAGPETLDWDAQPNPFREFSGCVRTPLPVTAQELGTSFAQVYAPAAISPLPVTLATVGNLMHLAMGLSAWKEYGPDRWALRCNPSSGNLHPTEGYVFSRNVPGLDSGLHHYVSRDHVLELRCRSTERSGGLARLWVGFSSIHWREAWKYGERAFRYCQLDIGHALGAVRYAAGALGWSAKVIDGPGSAELSALMGLDRAEDFSGKEREDADLLIEIVPHPNTTSARAGSAAEAWESTTGHWAGRANLLDPHPIYRWPVIDQVSAATRGSNTGLASSPLQYPPLQPTSQVRAADIILGRRSAQRFDRNYVMNAETFYHLLDCLIARPIAPWDVWDFAPHLHPVFFVHRVEGLEPGLYVLPRHPNATESLRQALRSDFEWRSVENAPAHLPFRRLLSADCRGVARTLSCHQAIAAESCFALSMLSEFEHVIRPNAHLYRQLHWEAGLLGHVLYLEAEAAGLRGTGIGCYFDDAVHELFGITTTRFQALYHFTVGRPLTDDRITTLPAYSARPGI